MNPLSFLAFAAFCAFFLAWLVFPAASPGCFLFLLLLVFSSRSESFDLGLVDAAAFEG